MEITGNALLQLIDDNTALLNASDCPVATLQALIEVA